MAEHEAVKKRLVRELVAADFAETTRHEGRERRQVCRGKRCRKVAESEKFKWQPRRRVGCRKGEEPGDCSHVGLVNRPVGGIERSELRVELGVGIPGRPHEAVT